jgi:hypothetical protein
MKLTPRDVRWLAAARNAPLGVSWSAAPARFRKLRDRGLVLGEPSGMPVMAHITAAGRVALAEVAAAAAKPAREEEESLADIAVNATLKRATGKPLDPLEESLLP